jgi:hypothetical protein
MVLTWEILLKNETRRTGHVASVGKKKGEYRILVGTPDNNEITWRKWENNVTLKCFSVTIVAVAKKVSIAYS